MAGTTTMTLRPLSSAIAFWGLCGLGAILVGDAAWRGDWSLAWRAAGVIGFVLWCAWILLFRLSVQIRAGGILVVNLLRTVWIPWSRIIGFHRRLQILVELDDGTTVECWGSPFPRRPGARRGMLSDRRNETEPRSQDPARETLEYALASASASDGDDQVRRNWDATAILVGGVLLIGACAGIFLH